MPSFRLCCWCECHWNVELLALVIGFEASEKSICWLILTETCIWREYVVGADVSTSFFLILNEFPNAFYVFLCMVLIHCFRNYCCCCSCGNTFASYLSRQSIEDCNCTHQGSKQVTQWDVALTYLASLLSYPILLSVRCILPIGHNRDLSVGLTYSFADE